MGAVRHSRLEIADRCTSVLRLVGKTLANDSAKVQLLEEELASVRSQLDEALLALRTRSQLEESRMESRVVEVTASLRAQLDLSIRERHALQACLDRVLLQTSESLKAGVVRARTGDRARVCGCGRGSSCLQLTGHRCPALQGCLGPVLWSLHVCCSHISVPGGRDSLYAHARATCACAQPTCEGLCVPARTHLPPWSRSCAPRVLVCSCVLVHACVCALAHMCVDRPSDDHWFDHPMTTERPPSFARRLRALFARTHF